MEATKRCRQLVAAVVKEIAIIETKILQHLQGLYQLEIGRK
jgi:hypothetical protein